MLPRKGPVESEEKSGHEGTWMRVSDLRRWVWTGLLGVLSRHRAVSIAILSTIGSALAGLAFQNGSVALGLGALCLIFLIALTGAIPDRYGAADLVQFSLPAIFRVLGLNEQTDRIAVHHLRSVRSRQYEQLTDYYPDGGRRTRGRVFSFDQGIVGKAFKNRALRSYVVPSGKTTAEAMVEDWSFSPEEVARLDQSRHSYWAFPIGQEGPYPKAVLYMDSADPARFDATGSKRAAEMVETVFLPQLIEALRTA